MNINFSYGNFNSSYGMQQIPVVRPQDVAAEDSKAARESVAPAAPAAPAEQAPAQVNRASRIANLEDVSLTFNKESSFDSIGTDADLADLDMTKAISDMKRDSILSDYQTFVGPSADQFMQNLGDGIVIQK